MYTSGGCCTELGKTLAIWITTCGAIASTAGVDLSIPPVAPADVPAIPAQELGHLPAVLLGYFVVLCVKNAQNTLQLKKKCTYLL